MAVLRPYQTDVIRKVNHLIDTQAARRCLLVAPTGAGKTVIAASMIDDRAKAGGNVLVLVHRRELVRQMSQKLGVGIDHGIIQAGVHGRRAPVQVASIQTLHARAIRSERIDLPKADLIVIDEAHHVRARTWTEIVDAYPDAAIVGLTATPCRGDGRGLGNAFDALVECPDVASLTEAGHLVPAVYFAPYRPDLKGVKISKGDYAENQLAERMDKADLVGDIVEQWLKLGQRRRTVVFCTSVGHSVHVKDRFREAGVLAEHVDASTPGEERDAIMAQLHRGQIEVVSNCFLFTEGWDEPTVSCLILARPTKHMGLYRQMVGRVLRPSPGKTDAIIIDHAGTVFEHGFVDEPVLWTLKDDKRAKSPKQEERKAFKAPSLTTCPECRAVRMEGKPCPACGWKPKPKPQEFAHRDGQLSRVERAGAQPSQATSPADKMTFLAELRWYAQSKGHKAGWAAYKFKEKYGDWPPRSWNPEPVPASFTTASWIKSRIIAWRKSQERGA